MVCTIQKRLLCLFLCTVLMLGSLPFFAPRASAAETCAPAISLGNAFTVALDANGSAYAWGDNSRGTLGNNDTTGTLRPVPVTMPSGTYFRQISAGFNHVLALGADGNVYAWGANDYAQLGLAGNEDVALPTAIPTLADKSIISIAAGKEYSLALTEGGAVYAWGSNANGQLGSTSSATPVATPQRIAALSTVFATAIYAGPSHAALVTADGEVLLWGDNRAYQCGIENANETTPTKPASAKFPTTPIAEVALGNAYSIFRFTDGSILSFGKNTNGQFANDATASSKTYVPQAAVLGGLNVTAIAASEEQTLFLSDDGALYTAGLCIGDGEGSLQMLPTKQNTDASLAQIFAGYANGAAIGVDGTVWTWGDNTAGQLGTGDTTASATPLRVTETAGGEAFVLGRAPTLKRVPMLFSASIPAPTYTVTIPSAIAVGNLYQKEADDADRYSTAQFTVTAANIANFFGEKRLTVTLSTDDGKFELKDPTGNVSLPYELYNRALADTPLQSNGIFATFEEDAEVVGQIRIDQSLITHSGNYTDTVHFHIALESTEE